MHICSSLSSYNICTLCYFLLKIYTWLHKMVNTVGLPTVYVLRVKKQLYFTLYIRHSRLLCTWSLKTQPSLAYCMLSWFYNIFFKPRCFQRTQHHTDAKWQILVYLYFSSVKRCISFFSNPFDFRVAIFEST